MHVDVDKSKTTLVIFIHYMKLLDAIWILSFHNTRPSRSVVGCYCCCLPRNKVEQFRHRRRDMLSGSAVVVLALTTETLPSRSAVGLCRCCSCKFSNASQLDHESQFHQSSFVIVPDILHHLEQDINTCEAKGFMNQSTKH